MIDRRANKGATITVFSESKGLTHLCRLDSSTITIWTGLFPSRGCLASFYDKYVL